MPKTAPNALNKLALWKAKMSWVIVQRWKWCEQDHANVSVESSTSSDQQQRRPDVHKNSVDRTILPADDWQQNADAALMQRLESSEQPGTEEQYRLDSVAWLCRVCTWHAQVCRVSVSAGRLKTRDCKTRDQFTRVENAGPLAMEHRTDKCSETKIQFIST